MAAKSLLPGFGGRYTSETISAITSSSASSDTLSMHLCPQFGIELIGQAATGSIQVQQTFDGTNWANLGSAMNCASTQTTVLFEQTDGPFGVIRFVTSITFGTCNWYVVGFPINSGY